jgi:hypothetical protein
MVRRTGEETLNAMLDAEADRLLDVTSVAKRGKIPALAV